MRVMVRKIFSVLAVLAVAGAARAEAIDIKNASFEVPVLDAGGWTNDYPDWEAPPETGDAFVEYIDGFSSDGVNHIGIQNGEEVSQDLGVPLLPNSIYTLTVGIGNRNASFTPTDGSQRSTFGLYLGGDAADGGTLLDQSTVDAGPIGESTFADFALIYSTGETVAPGNLFISLRTTGEGRAHYDNIRLEVVPEPSSLVVLGLAGLGLVIRRRRR
jgi:hypothetical protein